MTNLSSSIKTQVAIIGAGPTGLSLAAQLIRHRIDFVIIDKREGITNLSKALVVHARTLEIFKELGLSQKAVQLGQIAKWLNLIRHGKEKALVDIAGLGKGMSEFPFVLSLEQSRTEQLLYDFLLAHNKDVHWQSEFTRLEEIKDAVIVSYKDANGEPQTLEATYLVGCDGAHSPVRHQLGVSFEGDAQPKLFYVADVMLTSDVINKPEFYFFLTSEAFVAFFTMEGQGHYRVIGVIPDGADPDKKWAFSDIAANLQNELECSLVFEQVNWFSTYKISSRKADAFSKGACFIAGDAGHIHTPAGGQGMNTGIQDAYNLAWKMAFSIRDQINKSVLKTYSQERMQNAANLLKTTDFMFGMMAGTSTYLKFFGQHIFPLLVKELSQTSFGRRKVFPQISQIGVKYPDSYLTVKSSIGSVKAGDRMPYFITPDGQSIYDFLTEPAFKLLSFGSTETVFSSTLSVPYQIHRFTQVPKDIFGASTDFYILLRPDNHIAYIGKDSERWYEFLDKISAKVYIDG